MAKLETLAALAESWATDVRLTKDASFLGFHRFQHPCDSPFKGGKPQVVDYGSFEVFEYDEASHDQSMEDGFYWWSCSPGCLPDSDPNGPFPTAEGAYLDAMGE